MPLLEITAEQASAGIAALEPEWLALLEGKKVGYETRAVLGHLGITRLQTYANLEADESKLRETLADDLGLSSKDGIKAKIEVSALVETWKAARQRGQAADEALAEARASGRPREVPPPVAQSIRKAHSIVYGKREDADFPSRDYIAWRFSQFDDNEYRAERLSEVVSAEAAGDDGGDGNFTFSFSTAGRVTGVRQRKRVEPPQTPEQLRRVYRLMAVHWEIMKQTYPDRKFVALSTSEVWNELVTHLLGPKIYEYRSRHNVGLSWEGLLEYEYQIRRKAMELVTETTSTLDEALRAAWKDTTLENRHFTLELVTAGQRHSGKGGPKASGDDALAGTKRALDRELQEVKKLRAQLSQACSSNASGSGGGGGNPGGGGRGSGGGGKPAKGGGRGGGGGGLDQRTKDLLAKLQDVRRREKLQNKARGSRNVICTWYQTKSCRNGDTCRFDHICLRCHQPGHGILDDECRGERIPK